MKNEEKDKGREEVVSGPSKLETDAKEALAKLDLPKGATWEVRTSDEGKPYVELRLHMDPKEPHSQIETLTGEDYLDQEFGMFWLQAKEALDKIGVGIYFTPYEKFKNPVHGIIARDYPLSESLTRIVSGRIAKLFGRK